MSKIKHGLYKTWCTLRRNHKSKKYVVCSTWFIDFYEFVKDIEPKEKGKFLIRKDNSKEFGPDNFQWVDKNRVRSSDKGIATKHPLYGTWQDMKKRCYNPKNKEYHNYMERGIIICEEWKTDFWQFAEDMGTKPSSTHTIDRINNDGNYCKSNCKWSTKTEQMLNRRPKKGKCRRGVTYRAEKKSKRYHARIVVDKKRLHLGYFETEDEAYQVYRKKFVKNYGYEPTE